jgi:hypothetical protein
MKYWFNTFRKLHPRGGRKMKGLICKQSRETSKEGPRLVERNTLNPISSITDPAATGAADERSFIYA